MTALDDLFARVYGDTKMYNAQASAPKTAVFGSTGYAGPATERYGVWQGPNAGKGVNNGLRKSVKTRGKTIVINQTQPDDGSYKPPTVESAELGTDGSVKQIIEPTGETHLVGAASKAEKKQLGLIGSQTKVKPPTDTGTPKPGKPNLFAFGQGAGSEFGSELAAPTDKAQHAQNFAQWLVNAASSGLYGSATAARAAFDQQGQAEKQVKKLASQGKLTPAKNIQLGLEAQNPLNVIGGGIKGIAEGLFNYREKGKKPLTWGQNLEAAGTKKALEKTMGKQAGDFTQGAIGTAADILGDPTSFVGLGIGGGIKGAVKGGIEGARAGAEAARVAAAAGERGVPREIITAGSSAAARAGRKELRLPAAAGALKGALKGGTEGALKVQADSLTALPDLARTLREGSAFRGATKTARVLSRQPGEAGTDAKTWRQYITDLANEPNTELRAAASPTVKEARQFAKTGKLPDSSIDKIVTLATQKTAEPARVAADVAEPAVGVASRLGDDALDETAPVERAATPEPEAPALPNPAEVEHGILADATQPGTKLNASVSTAAIADAMAPAGQIATKRVPAVVRTKVDRFIKEQAGQQMTDDEWERRLAQFATTDPRLGAVLQQPMVYQGRSYPLSDVLHDVVRGGETLAEQQAWPHRAQQLLAAMRTGTSDGFYNPAVVKHLFADQDIRGPFDPDSIAEYLNGAEALGKDRREKIDLLNTLLKPTGTKRFTSVDDAIQAGVDGGLKRDTMRMILNRLGIQTKTRTSSEQLRSLLDGPARTNWAAIQGNLVTPSEAYGLHGVSDTEAAAARSVDVDQAAAEEGAEYARTVQALGYDPTAIKPRVTETGENSIGEAIWEGAAAIGKITGKGVERGGNHSPRMVEVFDSGVTVEVHKAISRVLTKHATLAKLSGDARAAALDDGYLTAIHTVESYAKSVGLIPRVMGPKSAGDPLYVSWGEVYGLLTPETRRAAFFAADRGRVTHAAEKARQFSAGFTAYPNVVLEGVKAAVRGADAQTIMHVMKRQLDVLAPDIEKTWPGAQKAYSDIANELADPARVEALRGIDAQMKPVAVAMSDQSTLAVMTQLRDGIIPLVARGDRMDRGQFFAQVQQMLADVRRNVVSAAGYEGLTQTQTIARMDSAFVNGVLGERGAYILNQDERMVQAAGVRGTAGGGMKATRDVGGQTQRTTQARVATLEDNDDLLRQAAGADKDADPLDVAPENPAATDDALEREQEYWDYQTSLLDMSGAKRGAFRLATGLDATFGIGREVHAVAAEARHTGHEVANAFTADLGRWLHGGHARGAAVGQRSVGIDERLAAAQGLAGRLGVDQTNAWLNDAWHKLAAVEPGADEQEMLQRLQSVMRISAPDGTTRVIRAYSEDEAKIAMELKHFIDQVFGEGEMGFFNRNGMHVSTLTGELGRYKAFKAGGDFASAVPDPNKSLSFQGSMWREIGDEVDDKLEMLSQFFRAETAAMQLPAIGAQVSKVFRDEIHLRPTPQQISELGLRRLNASNSVGVGRYIDSTMYWTADEIKKFQLLDQITKWSQEGFKSPMARVTWRIYDAITQVLKPLATIYRPGHWVTNLLGDSLMNLMDGVVNPLDYVRGFRMLAARNNIVIDPTSTFASLERLLPDAGQHLNPEKFGDVVYIKLANGQRSPISLTQLYAEAERRGVAMNHSMAADIASGVHAHVNPSLLAKTRRATGLPQVTDALSRGSALRDNLTRLPHFITELERHGGNNIEDALNKAAARVHDYHPTSLGLGHIESKYMRRIFYFYTWTRLTASRIIRTALDHPGLVTMPSKFQYELAQANGLNPESIGQPFDPDNPNIPDYFRTGLLGPTQFGGLQPGENGDYSWGYSPSAPQIDTLSSLFTGWNTKPGANAAADAENMFEGGLIKNTLWGNLSPIIKAPVELTFGQQLAIDTPIVSDNDKKYAQQYADAHNGADVVARDKSKYLFDQFSGAAGGLTRATPLYNQLFPSTYTGKGAGGAADREQNAANQKRYLLNYLLGLRLTNYDSPSAAGGAANGK